jgi:ABC-type molybdate transport system substrate-binding protein
LATDQHPLGRAVITGKGFLEHGRARDSAYAAAIPQSSTDAAAARAFIAALTSAAMAERWRANGFEPPK